MTDLLHHLQSDAAKATFTHYQMRLRFRDKLLGGTPKDPKIIEGWLRAKAGIKDDEEVRQAMVRTLVELGAEVTPDMPYDQLVEASSRLAAVKNTNGFKSDEDGLYLEDRIVKAAIKECVNILFAGDRWGKTRKGPKNFTAERVFVSPPRIHLGRTKPDGVELQILHGTGPSGPVHSLSYSEYVEHAEVEFQLASAHDEITVEQWAEIFTLMQENGLGASRAASFGRFDIIKWERVS